MNQGTTIHWPAISCHFQHYHTIHGCNVLMLLDKTPPKKIAMQNSAGFTIHKNA